MKEKKTILLLIFLILFLLLIPVIYFALQYPGQRNKEVVSSVLTYKDYVKCELFEEVPAMIVEGTKIGDAVDYGDKNYVLDINGTTISDYNDYIKLLLKEGFEKHSDNGTDGMEGLVYSTTLTQGELCLTVSHLKGHNKTYLHISKGEELSEHLIKKEEKVADQGGNPKTKLHMLELNNNGSSFVIQLKNGHFIIEDGGLTSDAPYLLDYLERLTPEGEMPIVDAWFITHAHADHWGALKEISGDKNNIARIRVEGFYFTSASNEVIQYHNNDGQQDTWFMNRIASVFQTESGEQSKLYRMHLGQRFYFDDVIIDIPLTLEQFPLMNYYTQDFNETSTWLMHQIEGQKFLNVGDTYDTGFETAMQMYPASYFDVEIYAVSHHGINVRDYFTEYCTVDTALYPNWRVGSLWQDGSRLAFEEANENLKSSVKEALSFGDGTVVLTFPYEVGTAEILEPSDWRYSAGEPIRTIFQ